MSARGCAGVIAALGALAVAAGGIAWAETRSASIGNYYYEDDVQRDRTKIVVRQGDQITFVVRESGLPNPSHTVDVDELDIHSPQLVVGETFTTPPLRTAGSFRLYCRPHEADGHFTRLIIQSVTPAGSPAPDATPARTSDAAPGVTTPAASPSATPASTLAPVGVGKASREDLERPVAVDPDSLEGLTGRASSTEPWTRALWFLVIASVPILAAAIGALRLELMRGVAKTGTARSSPGRPRSPSRSPRSSTRKASGSGRTSRGRRR